MNLKDMVQQYAGWTDERMQKILLEMAGRIEELSFLVTQLIKDKKK